MVFFFYIYFKKEFPFSLSLSLYLCVIQKALFGQYRLDLFFLCLVANLFIYLFCLQIIFLIELEFNKGLNFQVYTLFG